MVLCLCCRPSGFFDILHNALVGALRLLLRATLFGSFASLFQKSTPSLTLIKIAKRLSDKRKEIDQEFRGKEQKLLSVTIANNIYI